MKINTKEKKVKHRIKVSRPRGAIFKILVVVFVVVGFPLATLWNLGEEPVVVVVVVIVVVVVVVDGIPLGYIITSR